MQTNFTPEQLQNPRISEANDILRSCVHCGMCTATCSTYVLLGDERDSPRGRIYLIKDMFENGKSASPEVSHHVDRCLSCLSCMTTCPSGVDYMHLVDVARAHIHETGKRSLKDKATRQLLALTLPYPRRFRFALAAGSLAKPLAGLFQRLGLKEMAAMLALAPGLKTLFQRPKNSPPNDTAGTIQLDQGRVILMRGCAQQVLRPDINAATERLLSRIGVETVAPPAAGCCGALVHHMGRESDSQAQAAKNVRAWWEVIQAGPLDAIVINASGCGTTVKDYVHMLKGYKGGALDREAMHVAALTKDITEFLTKYDLGAPKRWSSLRVAYHSACSMQHGQKLTEPPKKLLQQAGFAVVSPMEGHICCGSAGVYNILQPEIANELRERKVANIEMTKPDIIAAGNLGCMTQIQSGTDIPVVHTVELLDWAYGGPCPRGLEHLEDRVNDVPQGTLPEHFIAA